MRSIKLDQRITLSQEQERDDGGGGYDLAWVDVATVWASVQPVRGREQVSADKQEGTTLYRVTVRAKAVPGGVGSDMRLTWKTNGDMTMNVREVLDEGPRAGFVAFYAEAGVAT